MVHLIKAPLLALILLAPGCVQSYWAFPPGKNIATFKIDELSCHATHFGLLSTCLRNRGYQEITYEEFIERNKQAQRDLEASLKPVDIAAYDVNSNEIYIGKAQPLFETRPDGSVNAGTAITMEGVVSKVYCSGQGELPRTITFTKGSLGTATLICKDGRIIKSAFTYETQRSGYGSGTDGAAGVFRFIFGDLNLDVEELRKLFTKPQTDKPPTLF